MTPTERRQAVIDKYKELIGRNIYSQPLRDYCYKQYRDHQYYSDCSSSICYAYAEAGESFGILNTAGIYQSPKLTTVDAVIVSGVPDESRLRPGDMLEFAGTDKSRPLRIGHVEMYCGHGEICGHGSGHPSYKNMAAYCRSRYNQFAPGGWRKGLACVRRYIQSYLVTPVVPEPTRKSGWQDENGGRRYYLGNSGDPVRNSWHMDADGEWYWFDAAGMMVCDKWYKYKGDWYYLGSDGAMRKGLQDVSGKWYYLGTDGKMVTEPVTLTPDQDGALRYPGLAG